MDADAVTVSSAPTALEATGEQGLSWRLTDPEAMGLLRARISGGFMLLGWVFVSIAALSLPGGITRTTTAALLSVSPIPLVAGLIIWRGSRLADMTFVVTQCLIEALQVPFAFITQKPGALAGAEIALMAPVVISAIFAGRRRHVVGQVMVTIVVTGLTTWHRIGADPSVLVPAIMAELFAFVCVGFSVRLLRDLAVEAVARAERGEVTDPLTGLLNRRGLERTGVREWSRRAHEHLPLAVLMIDIDHFKRVNDSLGHAAGDHLLRLVAARLTGLLREGDRAFRLGGEEFVLLAHCRPGESAQIAERVRSVIESELPVTVSIGVLEAVPGAASGAELDTDMMAALWAAVDTADQGLYEAKSTGRNKVIAMTSA